VLGRIERRLRNHHGSLPHSHTLRNS